MAKINYLAPFLFILLNLLCFVQNKKQEDTEWISFWDTDNGFIKEMKEHETKKRFAVEFNSTSSAYTGPDFTYPYLGPDTGIFLNYGFSSPVKTDQELIEEGITGDDFDNTYLIDPNNTLVEDPGGVGVADDGNVIYEEGASAVIITG